MLPERLQDICHFLITFHTPTSFSTPHIYISTRPFLPSQSSLLKVFNKEFTGAITMRVGNLSSWPAPPSAWTGHTGVVYSLSYSPNGAHVVTGSEDKTIRIWDVESGAVVGEPLAGHTDRVMSVAYSPDGRHIISGSEDHTIRIWDAKTGTAVGNPLEGHADGVLSVAYSPDGRHIISGSYDRTIRIWGDEAGTPAVKPFAGHTHEVESIASTSDGRHIVFEGCDNTTRVWDAFTYPSIRPSCNPIHLEFFAKPDMDGWVRDSKGGLLYWVPHECRKSIHSPALMTIPLTSRHRSVFLEFDNIALGTSWTQIFKSAPS